MNLTPHRSLPLPSQGNGLPLKTYLTRLLWLCILPLLVLAAWLAYDSVRELRAEQQQTAKQMADNFASTTDQYLRSRIRALNMLAISPLIDRPDQWPLLYQQAKDFQASFDGHVILADVGTPMRMLFNTRSPYGTALPPLPRPKGHAAAPTAVQTLKPAVGDSFIGPVANTLLVAMAVPVLRDGQVRHVVLSTFEARQFQERIEQFELPHGWAMSLRDGRGDLVARLAPPGFDAERDVDPDGRFVKPLSMAAWRVELEVPRSVLQAPQLANGSLLLLGLLAATLTGVLGGTVASRRLGRAVASLTQAAPASAQTDIAEIAEVRSRLDDAASSLRASEARFRRLFEDAPVAMGLAGPSGALLAHNALFTHLFGYTLDDIPDLDTWWQRAYPDPVYRAEVQTSWGSVMASNAETDGDIKIGEYRVTCKDGSVRTVQIHGCQMPDGLLATFLDVTERRLAEDRLRLWAESFEHAQLGLANADARTNTLLTVNPTFASERGYTREEMVGMPLARLFPEGRRADARHIVQTVDSGAHGVFESEHLRKDGSRFPVLLDITVVRDAAGQPVTRVAYALDLTERKQAEARILDLNATLERRVAERTAELSAANRELDTFAYTVSHDLRAPLRAMDGYSQLLANDHGHRLDGDARHCLNQISASSHKMEALIAGILTLSRSARDELRLEQVDLSALATRRLQELARGEPARQVDAEVQPDLVVRGDSRMLDVVITNLVDNAWKYTGKAAQARIRLTSEVRDGQTWYVVSDNGAGFDKTHANHLFQPFQRLHRQDEFPGIGIGLATVQRIVQRHGGTIEAESAAGQGASFRFTLQTGA